MEMSKKQCCYPWVIFSALFLILSACAPPTPTPLLPLKTETVPNVGWQAEWLKTTEEARKEGSLIIYTSWPSEIRADITKTFKEKYAVGIEWVAGRAAEMEGKLFAERRAGIYRADVYMAGVGTVINSFIPAGILDTLDPLLVLPEVIAPNFWYQNRLPFVDEHHYIISLRLSISIPIVINTELVKQGEIKSFRDLLNPKWKGKIVMADPTTGGGGNSWVTTVAGNIMGLDFIKELARQEPVIIRDPRLQTEWVAKGKYPILIGIQSAEVAIFRSAGAPLGGIIPVEGTWMDSGAGSMTIINRPPNPNARKVFVNWMLSKEGSTLYTKLAGSQSARNDVPTDHLYPLDIRDPGLKYIYADSMENNLLRPKYQELAKEIFAASLK